MNVQIKFVTKQAEHVVDAAPLRVPSHIDKQGLDEILNLMLDYELPVHFEFSVMGNRIAVLQKTLDLLSLSSENVIEIEYMESINPPQHIASIDTPDWISSLSVENNMVAVASYDSNVYIYDFSGRLLSTLEDFKSSVKSVKFIGDDTLVAGSQSGEFLMYKKLGGTLDLTLCLSLESCIHDGSVNSIGFHNDKIITGCQDAEIRLFSTEKSNESARKKAKTSSKSLETIQLLSTLSGHNDSVSSVFLDAKSCYSGSWDQTIRCWDVDRQVNTSTLNCEKVVLALDYKDNFIATGHSDNMARLFDPRDNGGLITKMKLKGHGSWVSSVQFSKESNTVLATSSYDGTVKIWDLRAPSTPLHSVDCKRDELDTDKILALEWQNDFVFTGGESKKLEIFKI